ncbi:MAG TPA: CDP-glucose 4,6-dehydratase [Acidimicrobiales bacterium]|nr:CDP-glucose 4,6-dehydratase [Acidimicrobiales bacterium]
MEVDRSAWRGRRVLVTGHTGFKGAWLALWLQRLGAEVTGVALPAADVRGAWPAMAPWDDVRSIEADIRDPQAVHAAVARAHPEVVFHLAAQAIVREGYADPVGTYATNVQGTLNVLEAVTASGGVAAAVVVTSDKVYENRGTGRAFAEDDRLGGADPYSSSKACAELAVAAWRRSFLAGRPPAVATARAGNVLGGGDRGRSRVAPDVQDAVTAGVPVVLRYPDATRPWQFVLDPLRGYLLLAQHLLAGASPPVDALNFGPSDEVGVKVRDLVERMLALFGGGTWELDTIPGGAEAPFLHLDASRAREVLGWEPRADLDRTLRWTAEWWRAEAGGADRRAVALSQLDEYEALA